MKKIRVFDTESDNLLHEATTVHCICVIDVGLKQGYKFHNDPTIPRDGTIEDGVKFLQDSDELVGHNIITHDIPLLEKLCGFKFTGIVIDTIVLSRTLNPEIKEQDFANRALEESRIKALRSDINDEDLRVALNEIFPGQLIGRHSLESWGYRLGDYKGDFKDFSQFTDTMLEYCIQDTRLTFKLYRMFLTSCPNQAVLELENEVAQICWQQECDGWYFNLEVAIKLYEELKAKRDRCAEQLAKICHGWYEPTKTPAYYKFVYGDFEIEQKTKGELVKKAYEALKLRGYKVTKKYIGDNAKAGPNADKHIPFNPSSTDHIARFFKEKYDWNPQIFNENDGKPSVTKKILEGLEYEEAKIILEHEELQDRCEKLYEGKANGWIKHAEKFGDSRVHGTIVPGGAVTSRATHKNPNMSQIPANDKKYGKECRSLFTVPKGYKLVGTDASALELRILAHHLYRFDHGEFARLVDDPAVDMHTMNQEKAGLPSRSSAKTLIYLIIYGGGAAKAVESLAEKADMLVTEFYAKKLINQFKNGIRGYWGLFNWVADQVRTCGHITAIDGRRLYVRKDYAALNTLLQSDGAIACKYWMVNIHRRIREFGIDAIQVGWSHDELQFQCLEEHVDQLKVILVECMEMVTEQLKFKCPLRAEVKVGNDWSETH